MTRAFGVFRALALVATILLPASIVAAAESAPKISGPITGGAYGRPFVAALIDLAKVGYVEREYFLEGTATSYGPAPGTTLTADGLWHVAITGSKPYKTRILVRLPK